MVAVDNRAAQSSAERATAAGLAFLAAVQQPDGSFPSAKWRVAGEQETDLVAEQAVFPTAFIASTLLDVPEAVPMIRRAAQFLVQHRDPEGVWRYLSGDDPFADSLAPDVDDTALATLILRAAGHHVRPADDVLLSNQDRAGQFFTWITYRGAWWRSPARLRIVLRRRRHLRRVYAAFRDGMPEITDMDAGVNANVVFYLGRRPSTERAIERLLDVARRAEIADRWYQDPITLWYLISRALRRHDVTAGTVLLERLAECRPSTPLQFAEVIGIALDWGAAVPAQWVQALLEAQSAAGGWERLAFYTHADQRWGGEATTAALCVQALDRWSRHPSGAAGHPAVIGPSTGVHQEP